MIELEDNFGDIIGKAQRGLGISDSELAKKSGASADAIRKVRDGQFDEATLRAIAPCSESRCERAGRSCAGQISSPDDRKISTDSRNSAPSYSGMLVNAYLVWDPGSEARGRFRYRRGLRRHAQTRDEGKSQHQNDFAHARASRSRRGFAAIARRNRRAEFSRRRANRSPARKKSRKENIFGSARSTSKRD